MSSHTTASIGGLNLSDLAVIGDAVSANTPIRPIGLDTVVLIIIKQVFIRIYVRLNEVYMQFICSLYAVYTQCLPVFEFSRENSQLNRYLAVQCLPGMRDRLSSSDRLIICSPA